VSPLDASRAIPVAHESELGRWLTQNARREPEVVVAIYKKASGKQTVTLIQLQEVALCHGWVDTQTKGLDDERYAIRFVPRRPGSNWSETNRRMARRLRDEGRITAAGAAALPRDL
jgi:uncharacterized protein YdeI (YjbR/CyaY-like superfamily)